MQRVQYSDRRLVLAGIPVLAVVLRHVGEPMPLTGLLSDRNYYGSLLFYLLEAGLVWGLNRALIRRLDLQYAWTSQPLPRFFIQALLAYPLTAVLMVMLSFAYFDVLLRLPPPFQIGNVFAADLPTGLVLVTIIHLLYTGMWMTTYHRQTVAGLRAQLREVPALPTQLPGGALTPPAIPANGPKTLLLNQGNGLVPVRTEDVAYAFIASDRSVVKTLEGKSYTSDATLEQLAGQLPAAQFFRVSRQFIVHRRAIHRVEREGTGRFLLHLHPSHAEEVAVSRRRAAEFRQWVDA
ncbi:MAG: LytTR family transcriptional regulator [Cytophagales bacterium]|nr:LytTR family transcriptional regulator [Cytophagales bacterium]